MARAKKTARAEARRKYRAEQGLPPETDIDETAAAAAPAARATGSTASPQRMSIGAAFKASFTPLDIRGDFAALPWIATRTKALWLPALITIAATIGVAVLPQNMLTNFVFAYFVQTPALGGVFLAGFLAPRASWLLGVLIGLLSALCYAVLILFFPLKLYTEVPPAGTAQEIIVSGLVLSPVMGAIFAAAAAWYRRFLNLSNPNRGRKPPAKAQGRPDGKSRTPSQKAPARR